TPGKTRPADDRDRLPRIREADATAEEQNRIANAVPGAPGRAAGGVPVAPRPPAAGAAELVDAGVLEKEVTLLRKEQAEARQVDLLLVGFDLREVGVDGEIPRQPAGDAVLGVEPDVGVVADLRLYGLP